MNSMELTKQHVYLLEKSTLNEPTCCREKSPYPITNPLKPSKPHIWDYNESADLHLKEEEIVSTCYVPSKMLSGDKKRFLHVINTPNSEYIHEGKETEKCCAQNHMLVKMMHIYANSAWDFLLQLESPWAQSILGLLKVYKETHSMCFKARHWQLSCIQNIASESWITQLMLLALRCLPQRQLCWRCWLTRWLCRTGCFQVSRGTCNSTMESSWLLQDILKIRRGK